MKEEKQMSDNRYVRKFEKAVKSYLAEQKSIGLSEETLKNYTRRLRRFEDIWSKADPEHDPAPEDIRFYRDVLQEKGLSKKTVKQYLIELKAFFEFACDPDFAVYEKNPVSKRMYPKITDEDDRIYDKLLDAEDLKKLFSNKKPVYCRSSTWPRNYAIITLLLDGKIRNKELLNLRLSDIDFQYKEVEIKNGKGGKHRWVTLSDISITAIQLYLKSGIRPDTCSDEDYLFGTTTAHATGAISKKETANWHKGTKQWLSALVEAHIANVTGKHGFRTHSLRHNGSVLDLNTGVRTERLQAELGHSSITTTEIYSGRLQSVRKTRDYQDVANERDKCAMENAAMLRAMA